MTKLILKLAVVFGGQGVMAWFFYRSRAVSHLSWTDSDFVVFGLPLLAGFAVAACVLFFSFHRKRIAATLGLSAVGAAAASFIGTSRLTNRCRQRGMAVPVPLRGSRWLVPRA